MLSKANLTIVLAVAFPPAPQRYSGSLIHCGTLGEIATIVPLPEKDPSHAQHISLQLLIAQGKQLL